MNRAAEALLGARAGGDEASLHELPPDLETAVALAARHVLEGKGALRPARARRRRSGWRGRTGRAGCSRAPRRCTSEEGQVTGATVILQDVTRLRRFDELRNDLVATVAHEFRTPLTSLRMAIHLCAEEAAGPLTEKQADLLGAAREDCERLQRIVDDLLDLSRVEAGRVELQREPVSPAALLAAATSQARTAAEAARVALELDPLPTEVPVLADGPRIDLVLANLARQRHPPHARRRPGDAHRA